MTIAAAFVGDSYRRPTSSAATASCSHTPTSSRSSSTSISTPYHHDSPGESGTGTRSPHPRAACAGNSTITTTTTVTETITTTTVSSLRLCSPEPPEPPSPGPASTISISTTPFTSTSTTLRCPPPRLVGPHSAGRWPTLLPVPTRRLPPPWPSPSSLPSAPSRSDDYRRPLPRGRPSTLTVPSTRLDSLQFDAPPCTDICLVDTDHTSSDADDDDSSDRRHPAPDPRSSVCVVVPEKPDSDFFWSHPPSMFARGQLPDNLPQFQTRQALLVVDLQNDFAAVDGKLPVTSPPGYLDRIRDVIPVFRAAGDVIWIRSEFESPRAVNARPGEDASVITDELVSEDLREGKPHSSARDATAGFDLPPPTGSSARAMGLFNRIAARYESHGPAIDEPAIPPNLDQHRETFLSRPACDGDAACCIADTHGSQFADMATPLVDQTRDAVFSKTHYSAFKDTTLLSSLRGNLVTELYICGVLTNISVYATALDAARHGFAITVLDDCLGYRSRARHDEAMKQMTEYMGAESMLSAELIHSIRGGPAAPEHKPERETTPTVGPATGVAELQGLVEGITLREGRSGRAGAAGSGGASGPPVTAEALEAVVEPKGSAAEDERRISPATVGVAASVGTIAPDRAASADIESLGDVEPALPGQAVAAVGTTSPPPSPPRTRLDTAGYVARPVRKKRRPTDPPPPLLDPEESLCEGDTRIQYELLPTSLNDGIFERLRKEVCWRAMFHKGGEVPRLVAVEGEVREDGSMPVYRHPADESPPLLPFSPAVAAIRDEVQKALGQPFNHVLMQCYRNGQDYISEHSDKTLDIVRGSSIVNVSLGAQRTMTLRTKKQDTPAQKASPSGERQEPDAQARRQLQRVPLPHNSMFVLGPATNMRWLHGIRQDRTVSSGRTPSAAETAYDGERISLTFRHIGTFLDKKSTLIWGQGAKSKMKKAAGRTVNGETPEAEGMIIAFGKENQQSEFDWDATYGGGFDVLDITASLPRLFLSGDVVSDLRVKLMLAEAGTVCEMGERAPSAELAGGGPATPKHGDRKVRLVDNDAGRTEVEGSMPILFYVETCHRQGGTFGSVQGRAEIVRLFSSVAQTSELCQAWSNLQMFPVDERTAASFGRELDRYERQAAGSDFLAGPAFTMADCAFYPLLATIMAEWAEWKAAAYPGLQAYHRRVFERRSVQDILRECANLGDAADTITVITAAAAARG